LYSPLRTGKLIKQSFEVTPVNPSLYLYYSKMAMGVFSGPLKATNTSAERRVEKIRAENKEFVLEKMTVRFLCRAALVSLGSWVLPASDAEEQKENKVSGDGDEADEVEAPLLDGLALFGGGG